MQNRNNQLASANLNQANEIAIKFEKIMKRFIQIRNAIDLSICSEEFVEAYAGLCEQLFNLANQVAISPQWLTTKQFGKLVALDDQMRTTSQHVECLYKQSIASSFNSRRVA